VNKEVFWPVYDDIEYFSGAVILSTIMRWDIYFSDVGQQMRVLQRWLLKALQDIMRVTYY